MSRDFTKNAGNTFFLGTGLVSTDLNGASKVCVHAMALPDTFTTTAGHNRLVEIVINSSSLGLGMDIDASGATDVMRVRGRSVGTDTLQVVAGTSNVGTGAWHGFGAIIDIGGDTIEPFLDGASEGGAAAVTFGNTTWTDGTPTLQDALFGDASPGSADNKLDGAGAEVAIWAFGSGDAPLSAADFLALSKGSSPLNHKPQFLTHYWPLWGRHSPEIDMINGRNGTITGTIAQREHPRVILPPWYRIGGAKKVAAPAAPANRNLMLLGVGA